MSLPGNDHIKIPPACQQNTMQMDDLRKCPFLDSLSELSHNIGKKTRSLYSLLLNILIQIPVFLHRVDPERIDKRPEVAQKTNRQSIKRFS